MTLRDIRLAMHFLDAIPGPRADISRLELEALLLRELGRISDDEGRREAARRARARH